MSKSALSPIEKQVKAQIEAFFPGNPTFIVGVSGGPDSMCLLHVFHALDVDAVAVHVNYSKRGKESDRDEELVRQKAAEWGFDCRVVTAQPEESGSNFQQWARRVRYDVFYSLLDQLDADAIAVAHHREDQVETVVQKIFRGAGLASWSAMEAWDEEQTIFRPLLDFSREEIEQYLERESIPYRIDQSNLSPDFARNFLRNEWLDRLEQYFPGWEENILRAAGQGRIFEKALEWISRQITDEIDRVDRKELLSLDPGLRKSFILFLLKKMDPGIEISGEALDQVDDIGELQTGKGIQLSNRYSLMRDRDAFKIVVETRDELEMVTLEKDRLDSHPFTLNNLLFELKTLSGYDFERNLYMDASKMEWPLRLRRWGAGDRFQPLGMEGTQKVSDHLANRQVSAAEKHKALVLESPDNTIYAVLFPPGEGRTPPGTISDPVKCDDTTGRCLCISIN